VAGRCRRRGNDQNSLEIIAKTPHFSHFAGHVVKKCVYHHFLTVDNHFSGPDLRILLGQGCYENSRRVFDLTI